MALHVATWYGQRAVDGTVNLTLAGYWYAFVSLPIFPFYPFALVFPSADLVPVSLAGGADSSPLEPADYIWHEGAVLPDFKLGIVTIVVVLMILVLLRQTFFAVQLDRARRAGSREYGTLGSRYVEGFRQKWLSDAVPENESLVGSSDIQSLADLANSFQVVRRYPQVE